MNISIPIIDFILKLKSMDLIFKAMFLLWFLAIPSDCYVKFETDITLSKQQVVALENFKALVLPKLSVDYMKEDIYLVKWLKAQNFDLNRAEDFLMSHLGWRKATNFDNLRPDEFADVEKEYPIEVIGQDREGRPLIQFPLDEWDLRKAAIAGKLDRLVLYLSKTFEEAYLKVRELQHEGQNVTRFSSIVNAGKLSVAQHVNPLSLPWFVGAALTYVRNFPKMGSDIWCLNSSPLAEIAINLAKSVMDEESRDSFIVYGSNKNDWIKKLEQRIDFSQLTAEFGGTMPSKHGFQ